MAYRIPLFDLNFDNQEEQAVVDVIKSKWISTGPKCKELESLFCQNFNVEHAVSLANCTVSLHLALKLVGVKEGDEVICPSLTFVATANAIRYLNATPVFCDIKSLEHVNIDASKIEKLITERTKAIIVMHYGGFACEMNEIMQIAKKHNLKVVEDACHGPLSEYQGKKLGTIGDIGCFSFFSNKNISTGEGGMLITNKADYAEKARLLRSHGMTTMSYQRATGHATEYDVIESGYNYRMDDIHAALGIVQLNKLKDDLMQREKHRQQYLTELNDIEDIVVPFKENKEFTSNYIFPIVLKNSTKEKRDEVRRVLQEKGIQTSVHYPAVHRFSTFKAYSKSLPLTEYAADNELTLPMFGKLKKDDISFITSELKKIL